MRRILVYSVTTEKKFPMPLSLHCTAFVYFAVNEIVETVHLQKHTCVALISCDWLKTTFTAKFSLVYRAVFN